MIRGFRTMLPPAWVMCAFVPIYGLCLGVELFLLSLGATEGVSYKIPRLIVLGAVAGLYGIYRVAAFHPAWRPSHFEWLATTPWTHRQPLPFGAIRIVWQDAVVIGILIVLGTGTKAWAVCPVVFLITHSFTLSIALARTGTHRYTLGVLFVLAFLLQVGIWGPYVLLAVPIACWIAYAGLKASLTKFPWEKKDEATGQIVPFRTLLVSQSQLANITSQGSSRAGWPYDSLKVNELETVFTKLDRVWASGLVGWVVFSLTMSTWTEGEPFPHVTFTVAFLMLGSAIRFGAYRIGHAPPISFLGRLFNRQWIIPGYDRVLVVPMFALVGGIGLLVLLEHLLIPPIAMGVSFAFSILVLTTGGPSMREWQLTGQHRIRQAQLNQTMFVEV